MFVDFFIRRPVFAGVCSFIIVLAGAITIPSLPIALYPNIVPPQVTVTSVYVGASAETVEATVTTPLEQEINGVEGMKYMTSTSGADGTSAITVTFDLDRDIDNAAVDVQNRVSIAQARLPAEVRAIGVTVNKSSPAIIMGIGLYAEDGRYSNLFISNYADVYLKDALKRVKGVGEVRIFGERKYSMRIWLDPDRLAARDLTAADVVDALANQNVQVAAGQIGQPPAPTGQMFQIGLQATGRLTDPAQFDKVVLKTGTDGTLVRLEDVGRAELGAEDYNSFLRFSGQDAVGLGIFQLPNANALDVEKAVRAELDRLAKNFPPGLTYRIAFNPTTIVGDSISEVVRTLAEAIALVVLVVFIFLQNWKSVLIPAITIPVSLVGTFAFMKLLGFSINTLTMFGLTLATGLVVDDAIVVLENIERFIEEKGMKPLEAARAAMGEVVGAVVATSLVLVSVFVPVAFFPGTTGQLYQQFALTIACSVVVSMFNALTLTPALSAVLLKHERREPGRFFALVNRGIDAVRRAFRATLQWVLDFKVAALALFVACLGFTGWLFLTVPSGFVPDEDQGYFIIAVQGPEGASIEYTTNVMKEIEGHLIGVPEIEGVFAVGGFSFTGNGPNKATIFPALKPMNERKGADQSAAALIQRLQGPLSTVKGATVVIFGPPAIQGIGNSSGFQFMVLDPAGTDLQALASSAGELVAKGNATTGLQAVYTSFAANAPQMVIDVNRERAEAMNVPIVDVFRTLQVYLGSQYVNDFNLNTRPYRVYVQADASFRANPRDIERLYVRSTTGEMVSMGSLVVVRDAVAPQIIPHFNMARSAEINGMAAPGYSSGQALEAIDGLAKETLPTSMTSALAGIAREQLEAGSAAVVLFALGVLFVYLLLAAQYESFVDPVIILLAVPLAIMGGLLAQSLRGLENDVFCQIGLVLLIGLSSKNAILIVEFANQLREREPGLSPTEAIVRAAEIRLRPILMTSFAFILGIVPLVFASGAGSAGRQSLGTVVFGGMLVSTFLSLYIVPVLYTVVRGMRESREGRVEPASKAPSPEPEVQHA
jgi:HAE1 family hydrophobic/amphiphilic exporter-1